ncbi:MAG: hypothetical protein E7006_03935 [Alphaproteobacteria bacterium]|nr:hypothetical protein [Alphaproteobacteria bacterium]
MQPTNDIIFNKLNEGRHTTAATLQQLDMFSDIPTPTNTTPTEYWYYSDLHNLFGETSFPTTPAPKKAQLHTWQKMYAPQVSSTTTQTNLYNSHTEITYRSFFLGGTHFKNAQDIKLSRYACWCLSRNNPSLAFARAYFLAPVITPNATLKDIQNYSYQISRIHLRETLKQYEKNLAGILNRYHADFSRFNHSMTMGFFYGYSANDLKNHYNIPSRNNDPLANYMGCFSLYARINALHKTIYRFNTSPVKNAETIYSILHQELIQERVNMLKKHGIAPEQDIHSTSVTKVESQLKQTEKEFIKKFANQKLR